MIMYVAASVCVGKIKMKRRCLIQFYDLQNQKVDGIERRCYQRPRIISLAMNGALNYTEAIIRKPYTEASLKKIVKIYIH